MVENFVHAMGFNPLKVGALISTGSWKRTGNLFSGTPFQSPKSRGTDFNVNEGDMHLADAILGFNPLKVGALISTAQRHARNERLLRVVSIP